MRLRSAPCDAVLIGGGVGYDEKLAGLKQQIIPVTKDEAPGVKVLHFDHAVDVPDRHSDRAFCEPQHRWSIGRVLLIADTARDHP